MAAETNLVRPSIVLNRMAQNFMTGWQTQNLETMGSLFHPEVSLTLIDESADIVVSGKDSVLNRIQFLWKIQTEYLESTHVFKVDGNCGKVFSFQKVNLEYFQIKKKETDSFDEAALIAKQTAKVTQLDLTQSLVYLDMEASVGASNELPAEMIRVTEECYWVGMCLLDFDHASDLIRSVKIESNNYQDRNHALEAFEKLRK